MLITAFKKLDLKDLLNEFMLYKAITDMIKDLSRSMIIKTAIQSEEACRSF
jgi:hypothetical protein